MHSDHKAYTTNKEISNNSKQTWKRKQYKAVAMEGLWGEKEV
jgi:hypothetical protein